MNPQLRNQILIGAVAGLVVAGLTFLFLGGKRDELAAAEAANKVLSAEVDKGNALKATAKKLEEEIKAQKARIDELIKIMPTEADRGDLPYRIKKLADAAGIEVTLFSSDAKDAGAPDTGNAYYTRYPVKFKLLAGYHAFGQFASLISGFEKIIGLNELTMIKNPGRRTLFPIQIECKVSAYVYKPDSQTETAGSAPKRTPAAPRASQAEKD
jgi:Tfp pilus assembly protein PilO